MLKIVMSWPRGVVVIFFALLATELTRSAAQCPVPLAGESADAQKWST